jgi:energy-converting hydrogenase B subunit D
VTDALLVVLLTLLGGVGTVVVAIREPLRQVLAVGIYGLLLGLVFFAVQAPDVALSQIVVGAVALPAMLLLALAKLRQQDEEFEDEDSQR